MSTSNRVRTLVKWIRGTLFQGVEDEDETNRVTRFELRQVTDAGENILQKFSIKKDELPTDDKIEAMAEEILDLAQEDSEGFSHTVSYVVLSFCGKDRKPSKRSPVIRLSPDGLTSRVGETEPANMKGLFSQLMRHNEALVRTVMQTQETNTRFAEKVISRLSQQVEKHDQTRVEMFAAVEELISEKHKRDLEAQKEERRSKQIEKASEKIIPLLPVMVNRLAGKKLLPQDIKDHPAMSILVNTLRKIKPEQVEEIASILGEDALPLLDLYAMVTGESAEDKETGS